MAHGHRIGISERDEGEQKLERWRDRRHRVHADASADAALDSFVAADRPETTRESAAFWLASARGRQGYEALRRMLGADPSPRVREKVIFALTQSAEPEALSAIIDAARGDESLRVRGHALFWLSQKAGAKAAETIANAIQKDPELEIKKKAVFALSQLPAREGVPKLIEVARTHRNPGAMFWLGQTKDPRALAFFEEILRR